MPTSALIITIAVLAGVLYADLGLREITTRRLLRPLILAGAVGSTFLTGFATAGTGLAIEIAGVATGATLGLLAGSLMRVERKPRDEGAVSRAGVWYALLWITVSAARLAFAYGSQHWFGADLGHWMFANHVTGAALTDALVLMALAMTTARTLSLYVRGIVPRAALPVQVS